MSLFDSQFRLAELKIEAARDCLGQAALTSLTAVKFMVNLIFKLFRSSFLVPISFNPAQL